jgi:hypothetical protein
MRRIVSYVTQEPLKTNELYPGLQYSSLQDCHTAIFLNFPFFNDKTGLLACGVDVMCQSFTAPFERMHVLTRTYVRTGTTTYTTVESRMQFARSFLICDCRPRFDSIDSFFDDGD